MHSPIILLAGGAGSGKDTVGSYLADVDGAVTVAQADPMKRFVAEIFLFSEDQLWGPSSSRNAPDPRTVDDKLGISNRFETHLLLLADCELFAEVVPKTTDRNAAVRLLKHWFERIRKGLEDGIPVSPRLVLQTLGTEWGRRVSKNMWNEYATETCMKLLAGGFRYSRTEGLVEDEGQPGYHFGVITDGRFRNEIVLTTAKGGVAIRIDRTNPDKAAVESGGVKGHQSEIELDGIPPHFYTAIVDNNGSLKDLYQFIDQVMRSCYTAPYFHYSHNTQPTVPMGSSS
jgi:deoxynucleotide monophosphate kinase-like protein